MIRKLLTLVPILLVSCSQSSTPTPKAEPAQSFPVPIVQLRGEAAELGREHGERLGEPIRTLFNAYFTKYFQNDMQRTLALAAASAFEPRIDQSHRTEITSLAASAKVDAREVLLGQVFLDLTGMTACSSITLPEGAAPDGVARFGRNLDFPGFNIADKSTVLFVYHPQGKNAFASIAWPGLIGVLSGMNEHGLTIANMEVDRGRRMPQAMPYPLLYRSILEQCKTVEEAIALLQKTPRQTANNLMMMDAAGNRAVAEITPEALTIRSAPATAALISTNHHRGSDLDKSGRCSRYDYLHDTAKKEFNNVSVEQIQDMLAHVAQGNMTLQSMIFEPSNRVLYLAVGANAPTRGYHMLDLKPLFR